jgi:ketosteroid isomerase-like protein
MSAENVERIRRAFERWNAGDREPPLDDFDPDIEIKTTIGDAFRGEPFRGHEGAREWLAGLDENFERWDLIADEFHDQGDAVVVLGHVRAAAVPAASSWTRWPAGCSGSATGGCTRFSPSWTTRKRSQPVE